jgi:hypothetical protein
MRKISAVASTETTDALTDGGIMQAFSRERAGERGNIIVLFLIILVPLLTVIGLAVDSGNLYRARLALQSSADASALAMVNFITMQGKVEFEKSLNIHAKNLDDNAKQQAINDYFNQHNFVQNLVRANLAAVGYSDMPGTGYEIKTTGVYTPGKLLPDLEDQKESAFDYSVEVSRDIDYWIMDAIPLLGLKDKTVTARATSRRRIAYISVMMDDSDSMGCPAEGNCDCMDPQQPGCPSFSRKFDKLVDAVVSFLKMFDLEADHIDLVPFNISGYPLPLDVVREENNLNDQEMTEQMIELLADFLSNKYPPAGATNVCDALMRSWWSMKQQLEGLSSKPETAYVLFSEGAPTGGRFLFTHPKAGLPPFKIDANFGDYDYSVFTTNWRKDGKTYPGPSLLYQSGLYKLGYNHVLPEADPSEPSGIFRGPTEVRDMQSPPGGRVVDCVSSDIIPVTPSVSSEAGIAAAADTVFSNCVSSLESHLPTNTSLTFGAGAALKDWRTLYYHCAVQMADFMRSDKGSFFVVGLGERNTATSVLHPEDPYQNPDDNLYRKDVFLSRLALDRTTAGQYLKPGSTSEILEFNYPGYETFEQWGNSAPERQGVYFPTSDATSIKLLFGKIARRILLKLVK